MNNVIKPEVIQKYLKKYVVGQDEFIKTLSVVAWIHQINIDRKQKGLSPINNNTLVIGPSGSGKTYSIKKLANILNVPFIEIDGSKLQGNNYRGCLHSYDMFNDAISSMNIADIERSIVFIDEFDKTFDLYAYKMTGARHVQKDFLKIFEQGKVTNNEGISIDLSAVTIICAGSFYETMDGSGSFDSKMGFGNEMGSIDNVYREITGENLIEYGHLPELIGRFARIVNINPLSKENIIDILKREDSLMSSIITQIESMGVKISVSEDYYSYLADNCKTDQMGFRSSNKLVSSNFDEVIMLMNGNGIASIRIDYKDDNVIYSCFDSNGKLMNTVKKQEKKTDKAKPLFVSTNKMYMEMV